jgi:hypothetical protein
MGADLGSRALAESLQCAATTLSLWSPLSLSGHMQDATTAASRLAGAPCPERASHVEQWRETPFCFCLPLKSTVSLSTIENSCPTTFDFEL